MRDRLRAATDAIGRELASLVRELAQQLQGPVKPCTCGDTRRVGPCPRHGTLG